MKLAALMTLIALLIAVPAHGALLDMSGTEYTSDARVEFTFTNDTQELLYLASSAPYEVLNLDTGEVTYFLGLTIVIELYPGESEEFGVLASELGPGRYALRFTYHDAQYEGHELTAEFRILGSVGFEEGSIGRSKAKFR